MMEDNKIHVIQCSDYHGSWVVFATTDYTLALRKIIEFEKAEIAPSTTYYLSTLVDGTRSGGYTGIGSSEAEEILDSIDIKK